MKKDEYTASSASGTASTSKAFSYSRQKIKLFLDLYPEKSIPAKKHEDQFLAPKWNKSYDIRNSNFKNKQLLEKGKFPCLKNAKCNSINLAQKKLGIDLRKTNNL